MTAGFPSTHSFARRKPPHRIIIAQGENVRSFTIRPWLIATVGGVTLLFGMLYLAATGYLVFRDDLLAASIASKARMQHAYEDRIASLRADIDRLTSRQLLNQEAVEAEMDRLSGRQAALDARQDSIARLSQAAKRAGIDATEAPAAADASADDNEDNEDDGPADSEVDKSQTTGSIAPVQAGVLPLAFAALRSGGDAVAQSEAPKVKLAEVTASLDALAKDQVSYVDTIASRVNQHSDQIAAILKGLGQRVPPSHATANDAVGGPFVAIDEDADPETFRTNVDLISAEIDRYGTLRRIAQQLPLARPMNSPITSGYGARPDPFLGRLAMHTGIDFRAAQGSLARATAGGTVITAEYTGGYGNMVEIDHGNGITTRYGHLSEIDVVVGQVVAKDGIIGRTGSTGRSTGPHLHYEVRVDGAAIDPMTWIKAGRQLAPLLAANAPS
jgi:murein DD-endopeptidase MepM/ murein hydrolase activator NlpD